MNFSEIECRIMATHVQPNFGGDLTFEFDPLWYSIVIKLSLINSNQKKPFYVHYIRLTMSSLLALQAFQFDSPPNSNQSVGLRPAMWVTDDHWNELTLSSNSRFSTSVLMTKAHFYLA